MGFLDDAKKKAEDVLEEHGDKIEGGIDKVADFVDDKTKGKHTDKIDKAADKAKDLLDKFSGDDEPTAKS